ncbi:MAG: NUDIX hydrolase, partial [Caldilineales bacterium]|nr:NUDIX hydrolase [Caldilineales bacterium]
MLQSRASDPIMPTIQPWRRLRSHTAFQNRWLRVDIDQVELPNGRSYDYTVLRRPQHGAAVLACDGQGRVLMQQEYRYPVDAVIWQLPGGLIDPNETPLEAAPRELAEATGPVAASWR